MKYFARMLATVHNWRILRVWSMNTGKPVTELSIEDLIRYARAGDEHALPMLFKRSLPFLDTWSGQERKRRRAHHGLDRPSDIAQETALRAFDRFSSFQGTTEAEWRVWLKRIFENRRYQGFRDATRDKRDLRATISLDGTQLDAAAAIQPTASEAIIQFQNWRQTLTYIYQLPDDQRDAIWMCHLQERTVVDVAAAMGRTEASVAGLLRRGLNTLRQRAASDVAKAGTDRASAPAEDAPESIQAAAALLAYLRQRDAGIVIEHETFLVEHASCADELESMLLWIDHIEGIRSEHQGT
ncbi:MAG: sigma-70 family RNA polymerase sigma factor [Proteobacteria bacterium]|nr:sigma-70 family RNA polymerase sigma factor [Pseudomonadota bacterium]